MLYKYNWKRIAPCNQCVIEIGFILRSYRRNSSYVEREEGTVCIFLVQRKESERGRTARQNSEKKREAEPVATGTVRRHARSHKVDVPFATLAIVLEEAQLQERERERGVLFAGWMKRAEFCRRAIRSVGRKKKSRSTDSKDYML